VSQVHPFLASNGKLQTSTNDLIQVVKIADKIVERNDSTTSTTTTVRIPILARRYRAQAIRLQRYTAKHRALPSKLPQLESQSSLTEDLVDWVVPKPASEKLQGTEWHCSTTASPSTRYSPDWVNIDTCTTKDTLMSAEDEAARAMLLPSAPDHEGDIANASDARTNEDSALQAHKKDNSKTAAEKAGIEYSTLDMMSGKSDVTTSIHSNHSRLKRKPEPATSRDDESVKEQIGAAFLDLVPFDTHNRGFKMAGKPIYRSRYLPDASGCRSCPASPVVQHFELEPLVSPDRPATAPSTDINAEQSRLQLKLLFQTYVNLVNTAQPTTAGVESPAEATPPQLLPEVCKRTASRSAPEVLASSKSSSSTDPVKPLSAQAKRRAAHAR
jgi:hypothetical protein